MTELSTSQKIEQGFACHQAGHLAEAEAFYRSALESETDNLNGLQLLGLLKHSQGNSVEAISLLERAVTLVEQDGTVAQQAALHNNLGLALRAASRRDDAIRHYRRGLECDPSLAELHVNLADELLGKGELEAAISSYVTAECLGKTLPAESTCNLARAYVALKRFEEAEHAYRAAATRNPNRADVLSGLAQLLGATGRTKEEVAVWRMAIAVDPASPHLRIELARALVVTGQVGEATEILSTFQLQEIDDPPILHALATAWDKLDKPITALAFVDKLLVRRPDDIEARILSARIYYHLADLRTSEEHCRLVLTRQHNHIAALNLLGSILVESEKFQEAVAAYRQLLDAAPDDVEAHFTLVKALCAFNDKGPAVEGLRHCLALDSQHIGALYHLGVVLGQTRFFAAGAACLQTLLCHKPDHTDALLALGNILNDLGQTEKAAECFVRAHSLRPVTTLRSIKSRADFAALVICSPGIANTPSDFLMEKCNYDRHVFTLLPGIEPDINLLRSYGDIVINLIADPDTGSNALPRASALIDQLGKPTFNHPNRIMTTSRDIMADVLADIPHCRIPKTVRHRRHSLEMLVASGQLNELGLATPILLRVPGTHGGDTFEKIDNAGALSKFLANYLDDEFYVTEYVDYQSKDSYFRKYRFIFTNGEILPYHLVIAGEWKAHHFRTDMDQHVWMQDEEKAFLENPHGVFARAHFDAFRAIATAIGLNFFGVDCSLDRDANLVIFEANAAMLVHDDNREFPYKSAHSKRIRSAFVAALGQIADSNVRRHVFTNGLIELPPTTDLLVRC
jgi:tetratricopeptide (TPR) repeat protein